MSQQESLGLGFIIRGEQQRDAVHVAVAPVTAGQDLAAGASVNFQAGSTEIVYHVPKDSKGRLGVVDPFLIHGVKAGQRCWLWLTPGSITSLRHDWTHPKMPVATAATNAAAASAAKGRLMALACELRMSYPDLVEMIDNYADHNGQLYGYGDDEVCTSETFWPDVFLVLGRVKPEQADDTPYFLCSC